MSIGEIFLIILIALIVIKPENLPATAFTLGQWTKNIREALLKIKQEWFDKAH